MAWPLTKPWYCNWAAISKRFTISSMAITNSKLVLRKMDFIRSLRWLSWCPNSSLNSSSIVGTKDTDELLEPFLLSFAPVGIFSVSVLGFLTSS